ncbi:hypothetical protein V501_03212 [Pseudogymnoascus sp. VKM F-4519 (FW-2642)]|nr:hypothetical protein V501_03212 [Pseudogymnoascus sp. VKM F-4519 (FW-2642)]
MPGVDPAMIMPEDEGPLERLPFPPVTKQHILNCSYSSWYPKYRTSTLRSRLIPLTTAFLDYLREDGLWLPDDDDQPYEETEWSAANADKPADPEFEAQAQPNDASAFADIHSVIKSTIAELGGSVVPKLNWSAPKDALHMALSKNSIACQTPQDIYLLLKSSIFVTHDLEHAFDDCANPEHPPFTRDIEYTLVLRPYFKINTSFEFRVFVRDRTIVGICQRELKHVDYSPELLNKIQTEIEDFYESKLKDSFPDPSFAFDVYLPEPHDKVRLIDINPWAQRTDPLLFSWLELLTMSLPKPLLGQGDTSESPALPERSPEEEATDTEDEGVEELPFKAEFRVVKKDDPEAYNFGTAPYSAHKLPKEVVDAGEEGGEAWRVIMERWEKLGRGEAVDDSDDSADE